MSYPSPVQNLFGASLQTLEQLVVDNGWPSYRGKQIADWLYRHHVGSIDEMCNVPAEIRDYLQATAEIRSSLPENVATSGDGTRKYLWPAERGDAFESALIPGNQRLTLCLSSQVGCLVGCKFCLTARRGLTQSLSPGEILSQYRNLPERDSVTHFVYMGMGEPLDNVDSVLESVLILSSPWGYGFSPRRVTVSTVGFLPELERLLDETDVNVAISLHAARREVRLPLVPAENRHPISSIAELLKRRAELALPPFPGTGRRRVSFELTMLDGINDTNEHARDLIKMMEGIPAQVNLIPWNPFPGTSFAPSSRGTIEAFQQNLKRAGITTTIRESRGQDIGAACGQLAGSRA